MKSLKMFNNFICLDRTQIPHTYHIRIFDLTDEPEEATLDLSVTSSSESSSSSDGNQSEEDPFKIDPYGKSEVAF